MADKAAIVAAEEAAAVADLAEKAKAAVAAAAGKAAAEAERIRILEAEKAAKSSKLRADGVNAQPTSTSTSDLGKCGESGAAPPVA